MAKPISSLTREEATALLKRRFLLLGAGLGFSMGILFAFVAPAVVSAFPGPSEPIFLILLFLSVLLFSVAGGFAGRRAFKKVMASRGGV